MDILLPLKVVLFVGYLFQDGVEGLLHYEGSIFFVYFSHSLHSTQASDVGGLNLFRFYEICVFFYRERFIIPSV